MNVAKIFRKLIRGNRGVATSLIEATATVAVGAVLAGVAVGSAIDAINDSKIQAAIGDVQVIGQGVITFYKDNSFFPLFKVGNETGPSDDFFFNLVSRNGTYPTDVTGGSWQIPASPVGYASGNATGLFGHDLSATDDAIEGHLVNNRISATFDPGDPEADPVVPSSLSVGDRYPLRGEIPGDPQRGWSGPYVASLTKTDPWGNKYLINVRMLHTGNFVSGSPSSDDAIAAASGEAFPSISVVVISAGPDRALDTPADQYGETFTVENDDIVFRIK